MIQYLQKDLQPSMQVKIKQRDRVLNNFEKIVEKIVNAKAKPTFRPRSYACNSNQHFLRVS